MDWEKWLQSNAGVLSLGLALALTVVPLLVAGFVHLAQRKAELRFKKFELYHDLIRRLVEPDQPDGEMRVSRQMAVVFELRNFPEYAEVSARILRGNLEIWMPEKPHLRALREEMKGTIQFLNSKLKNENRVALPPDS
jgi:hypothetical protein